MLEASSVDSRENCSRDGSQDWTVELKVERERRRFQVSKEEGGGGLQEDFSTTSLPHLSLPLGLAQGLITPVEITRLISQPSNKLLDSWKILGLQQVVIRVNTGYYEVLLIEQKPLNKWQKTKTNKDS